MDGISCGCLQDYDLHGEYVRHWLPELANVPEHRIHEPWTMTPQEQEAAGCHIGRDYPQPPKSRFVPQSKESERPILHEYYSGFCIPCVSAEPCFAQLVHWCITLPVCKSVGLA